MSIDFYKNSSFVDSPYNLTLRQTFSTPGTFSVTIPAGINRVWAVCIGGGGSGASATTAGGAGPGSSATAGAATAGATLVARLEPTWT